MNYLFYFPKACPYIRGIQAKAYFMVCEVTTAELLCCDIL